MTDDFPESTDFSLLFFLSDLAPTCITMLSGHGMNTHLCCTPHLKEEPFNVSTHIKKLVLGY